MKRILLCSLMAGACFGADAKPGIADFKWLNGCWQGQSPRSEYEECWSSPNSGMMIGVFRIVSGGKVNLREVVVLEESPQGLVMTVRHLSETLADPGKAVSFPFVKMENGGAVFENSQHDFPRRIVYKQEADGSLLARIEGPGTGGKDRAIDFRMRPSAR